MLRYIKFYNFSIPSYGLCMSIALVLCAFLFARRAQKNNISADNTIVISALSFGSAILGGALLYIIISYSPEQILYFIKNRQFSILFSGGLVFYGGLLGGSIGAIITSKLFKIDIPSVEKSVVPLIPLGHAIGRIGCLLAGCCYGRPDDGFFAVYNFYTSPTGCFFPLQLLESLLNLIIMTILLLLSKKKFKKYGLFSLYLFLYATTRFILEFFRGDIVRGFLFNLSTSQWCSLLIIFVLLVRTVFYSLRSENLNQ